MRSVKYRKSSPSSYRQTSILIILMASAILLYPSEANALNIEFTNYNVIDFGSVDLSGGTVIIDDVPYDGLVIRCTAGPGTSGWMLEVKIEHELTHETNTASRIPNTNFRWYVESTTGNTNNIAPGVNQKVEFTFDDVLVYTGDTGEDQTDITMKFHLELPPTLQWGTYNTKYGYIVFTLTE